MPSFKDTARVESDYRAIPTHLPTMGSPLRLAGSRGHQTHPSASDSSAPSRIPHRDLNSVPHGQVSCAVAAESWDLVPWGGMGLQWRGASHAVQQQDPRTAAATAAVGPRVEPRGMLRSPPSSSVQSSSGSGAVWVRSGSGSGSGSVQFRFQSSRVPFCSVPFSSVPFSSVPFGSRSQAPLRPKGGGGGFPNPSFHSDPFACTRAGGSNPLWPFTTKREGNGGNGGWGWWGVLCPGAQRPKAFPGAAGAQVGSSLVTIGVDCGVLRERWGGSGPTHKPPTPVSVRWYFDASVPSPMATRRHASAQPGVFPTVGVPRPLGPLGVFRGRSFTAGAEWKLRL